MFPDPLHRGLLTTNPSSVYKVLGKAYIDGISGKLSKFIIVSLCFVKFFIYMVVFRGNTSIAKLQTGEKAQRSRTFRRKHQSKFVIDVVRINEERLKFLIFRKSWRKCLQQRAGEFVNVKFPEGFVDDDLSKPRPTSTYLLRLLELGIWILPVK